MAGGAVLCWGRRFVSAHFRVKADDNHYSVRGGYGS